MKYYDPLVEEVRTRGRQLTARFDNDPKRIMQMLWDRAARHPDKRASEVRVVVSTMARKRKKTLQPTPLITNSNK